LSRVCIYFIQDIKRKYGFDYKHKASLVNLHEVKIRIPVNDVGEFDLNVQREIAGKNK